MAPKVEKPPFIITDKAGVSAVPVKVDKALGNKCVAGGGNPAKCNQAQLDDAAGRLTSFVFGNDGSPVSDLSGVCGGNYNSSWKDLGACKAKLLKLPVDNSKLAAALAKKVNPLLTKAKYFPSTLEVIVGVNDKSPTVIVRGTQQMDYPVEKVKGLNVLGNFRIGLMRLGSDFPAGQDSFGPSAVPGYKGFYIDQLNGGLKYTHNVNDGKGAKIGTFQTKVVGGEIGPRTGTVGYYDVIGPAFPYPFGNGLGVRADISYKFHVNGDDNQTKPSGDIGAHFAAVKPGNLALAAGKDVWVDPEYWALAGGITGHVKPTTWLDLYLHMPFSVQTAKNSGQWGIYPTIEPMFHVGPVDIAMVGMVNYTNRKLGGAGGANVAYTYTPASKKWYVKPYIDGGYVQGTDPATGPGAVDGQNQQKFTGDQGRLVGVVSPLGQKVGKARAGLEMNFGPLTIDLSGGVANADGRTIQMFGVYLMLTDKPNE